ncbi:hypothetical protein BGV48_18150 [Burkholderia ubonensis]|nr:hypothetical protein BGV48_18150 [Burkholderia ubonensis]
MQHAPDDHVDACIHRFLTSIDVDVWISGWLVRGRYSGELGNQSCTRLSVQAFDVSRFANLRIAVAVDLDEVTSFEQCADLRAIDLEWRNESCQDDDASFDEQSRYFTCAANVFRAIIPRES